MATFNTGHIRQLTPPQKDIGDIFLTDNMGSGLSAAASSLSEISAITLPAAGGNYELDYFQILSANGSAAQYRVTPLTDFDPASSGDYFSIGSPTTNYYVWLNVDGAGGDPSPGGTGIECGMTSDEASHQGEINDIVATHLEDTGEFSCVVDGIDSENLTINCNAGGATTGIANGQGEFSCSTETAGLNGVIGGCYGKFGPNATDRYFWIKRDGSGSNPSPGGTGFEVDTSSGMDESHIASAILSAFNALSLTDTTSFISGGNVVFFQSAVAKAPHITPSVGGGVGASTINPGRFQIGNAPALTGGMRWLISSPSTGYYIWYKVDGVGSDPAVAGRTGVLVSILGNDDNATVASKTKTALDAVSGTPFVTTRSTAVLTITNSTTGAATDAANGNMPSGFAVSITTQGS